MVRRVCIIGAGAAGLAALRHLSAKPHLFHPIAYERASVVGGTWKYTDKVGVDESGFPIHSSMYKNLKTNLPKEVMAFPDFPFKTTLPSFLPHAEVQHYLEDYAAHYDLLPMIKFNRSVSFVKPHHEDDKIKWEVKVEGKDSNTPKEEVGYFDMVMVCNGHYSKPLTPDLPGLESFQGKVGHSHDYRDPEEYRDKTVVLLGAASSGQDISLDVATVAKQVYLSHNRPRLNTPLPANMKQIAGFKRIENDGIVTLDEEHIQVDAILFCTGYYFDFPFLDEACSLKNTDEHLVPLYKHLIHIKYPSLCFLGIPKTICPFPLFDCQVRFIVSAHEGRMAMPSAEEMLLDTEKDEEMRTSLGMAKRHLHNMGKLQWVYNDDLAKLGGFEPIPRVIQKLYDHVHQYRVTNLPEYKRKNFKLMGPDSFIEQ